MRSDGFVVPPSDVETYKMAGGQATGRHCEESAGGGRRSNLVKGHRDNGIASPPSVASRNDTWGDGAVSIKYNVRNHK